MPIQFENLPKYGDHFTRQEFIDLVNQKALVDYDGHGYLATDVAVSDVLIAPSRALEYTWPKWATHVMWFNK